MVKKRDVNDFIGGADKEARTADEEAKAKAAKKEAKAKAKAVEEEAKRAPNDYKKISLSMNQYTYDLLVQAADINQRSLVQTMRLAIQEYSKSKISRDSSSS